MVKLDYHLLHGIIPKNLDRISKSIGNTISDNLLTEDVLKDFLLSDEIKDEVKQKVIDYLNDQTENDQTIKDYALKLVDENNFNAIVDEIDKKIAGEVVISIKEANIGQIISDKIVEASQNVLHNSILSNLGGNAIISIIARESQDKVNEFINLEAEDFITDMIEDKSKKIVEKPVGEIATAIGTSKIDLVALIMDIYEKLIIEKLPSIIKTINISKIVYDKIMSMDIKDVEKIILNIMNKELNSLVLLGGIIGFILGLFNLVV